MPPIKTGLAWLVSRCTRAVARGGREKPGPGGFNWVDVRDVVDGAIRAEAQGTPGEAYILYFPDGGEVGLELAGSSSIQFSLQWIELATATLGTSSTLSGGQGVSITAPGSGSWVATVTQ